MKKFFLLLCAVSFIFGVAGIAGATILTFDDIPNAGTQGFIPAGYGGFQWDQFGYIKGADAYPAGSGYERGIVSGDYVALNPFASVASIYGSKFDFIEASLTAAWNTDLWVRIEGFLSGNPIYTMLVELNTLSPTRVEFDWVGIDELVFLSFGGRDADPNDGESGTQFAMDDFTYEVGGSTPVPEPATMLLLGSGLIGMAAIGRKKLFNK